MGDMTAAVKELSFDLDRLIGLVEGLKLSPQLHDVEALELALFDLINAKAMLLLALIGDEVVH